MLTIHHSPSGETVIPWAPSISPGMSPTGISSSTHAPSPRRNATRLTRSDDSLATYMRYVGPGARSVLSSRGTTGTVSWTPPPEQATRTPSTTTATVHLVALGLSPEFSLNRVMGSPVSLRSSRRTCPVTDARTVPLRPRPALIS